MDRTTITAFGIYHDRSSFEHALSALRTGGIRETDISVFFTAGSHNQVAPGKVLSDEKSISARDATWNRASSSTLGWWTGGGAFGLRTFGPVSVAGPLSGVLARGLPPDSFATAREALERLGMPDHKAAQYQKGLENGGILLCIHCDGTRAVHQAMRIFLVTGAADVSSGGEPPGPPGRVRSLVIRPQQANGSIPGDR